MTAANARKHKKRETIETHRITTAEHKKNVHSYTLYVLYVYFWRHVLGMFLKNTPKVYLKYTQHTKVGIRWV